jgi:hypothetical protein
MQHRVRIKIPAKKGDAAYFSTLLKRLSGHEGIQRVDVNAVTGSLLLFHDTDLAALAESAVAQQLFALEFSGFKASPLHEKMLQPFFDLNNSLKRISGGEIDIPGIAVVGFVAFGIYQISRGNIAAPAWYTAFWYAMSTALHARSGKAVQGE